LEGVGGPGHQPQRRVGAEQPLLRPADVRQERPEHQGGQRLQGRVQRRFDLGLPPLAERGRIGLDGAADGGDGRLDRFGRAQVDQADLAPARGRDDPGGIVRREKLLLGPPGLEVGDPEPGDLDQDGLLGQGAADLVGGDPGVIAGGAADGLAQLPRQLPLLRHEPVDRREPVCFLAGPGLGQGQRGELVPHGRQLRHERGGGGVGAVPSQHSALGQGLLGHRLAVEHPAGRAIGRRGVVAPRQGQREGHLETRSIIGP